ncbi:coiled-coil domain-containing protein 153 [Triplophysa dalaica]|uniref:coiled-coil domain-containing protein 153 n=1 Tax=Triplophysa dalaica TaxID=1582913 RepID=UPI0024DF8629|nr:coiled-coil domain-containing protein 153 [Triplophysa dalaica]XP_056612622.1 coiled-coil domain-containing protein 153 [Triplophysa dalaica]
MPPKKKGKANSKKEKPKKSTPEQDDGLTEKYRRSVLDVAVLKEHLALRSSVARQATAARDDLKSQVRDLEQLLTQERSDMKDIIADLNRQYNSMETDLQTKVDRLEVCVDFLQTQLAECQVQLKSEREQREQREAEKEAIISDLQCKLDSMERECEKIMHGCLDSLLSQLAETRLHWEEQSTVIHQEVKDTLVDFGINPLYI